MISPNLAEEYDILFGPYQQLKASKVQDMLRRAWQGKLCSVTMRGMCWRVLLDLISPDDSSLWPNQLKTMVTNYESLKKRTMPSIDKVSVDPLSALSMDNGSMSDEWNQYYKQLELMKFIEGDLDRLYMTGLEDEYFHNKTKRDLLLAILVIWSAEHPMTSYRQGMHEVLGAIVYVMDMEQTGWQQAINTGIIPPTHPLVQSFQLSSIEAYAFYFFERIMLELEPLYDPLPVSGHDNVPFVVTYCTKIQEHYLGTLDPPLCNHLERLYIQSQLYGLRWSRLLLGREYPLHHHSLLLIWDYMFAACYEAEHTSNTLLLDDDVPPNVYSVIANVRVKQHTKNSNVDKRIVTIQPSQLSNSTSNKGSNKGGIGSIGGMGGMKKSYDPLSSQSQPQGQQQQSVMYVCTPLLGILADFMLAMLIQVSPYLMTIL